MTRLLDFFSGSDTEFGIFYPKHYLVAAFPNLEAAEQVMADLNEYGENRRAIAVSGDEMVEFAQEHLLKHGLWGLLMTELSRVIGTEAAYADHDLAAAKSGAAFLAVHCPTEHAKKETWEAIKPAHPLAARYYSAGGIEHLAGET